MERIESLLGGIVFDALLIFLLLGAAFALVIGLLMLLAPAVVNRLRATLDRRYSGRQAMKPMEIPRYEERGFYRHHKAWGAFISLGALVYLAVFFFAYDHAAATRVLADYMNRHLAAWLVDSGVIVLTAGNLLALAIGLIVFIRPSLLKGVEARANRWLSTRRLLRPLEDEHGGPDRFALAHPRLTGVLLSLGSLFVLASFGLMWFRT